MHDLTQKLVDARADATKLRIVAQAFRSGKYTQHRTTLGWGTCLCASGVVVHSLSGKQVDDYWSLVPKLLGAEIDPAHPHRLTWAIVDANDLEELTFERFADVFEEAANALASS